MRSFGPRAVRTQSPALAALACVAWLCLLVVLGASWGASAGFSGRASGDAPVLDVSAHVRHITTVSAGRTVLATARPSAKKTSPKGSDDTLAVECTTPPDHRSVGMRLAHESGAKRLKPAASGYLARAPPVSA